MPRYLLIAEKPSLCKAIKEAYDSLKKPGFDAEFFALHGHFMEAKEPDEYRMSGASPGERKFSP